MLLSDHTPIQYRLYKRIQSEGDAEPDWFDLPLYLLVEYCRWSAESQPPDIMFRLAVGGAVAVPLWVLPPPPAVALQSAHKASYVRHVAGSGRRAGSSGIGAVAGWWLAYAGRERLIHI